MYSLLIKNATVVDGSGKPGFVGDVAVQGDSIANVAEKIPSGAETVIDGTGMVLAPGFIDIQNHSDSYWQIFDNPTLDGMVTQGFTTIVIGNCGASLAPLLSRDALLSMQKWHNLEGVNINWQSFSEYVEVLSKKSFGCNVASLVGYSTLRRGIVGDQVRSLEKDELAMIKRVLEESLDAGAYGMSSGLSYAHEIIISELELFELAKIVEKKSGIFSMHLRSETSEVEEAVEEALDIARNTNVNLKLSHLKFRNRSNWDKYPHVINSLETAYHKGLNVHFDLYPYATLWQVLYSYLPKWAIEGGRQVMLRHFTDPVQRNKILSALNNLGVNLPQFTVASTTNKLNFVGKTIGQIAKNLEVSSEQAVLHILQNGGSEVMVFEKNLSEEQVESLLAHPLSFVATDGGGFSADVQDQLVHPRCFGTVPKFLKLVREKKLMTLEQAVAKLTSGPARKMSFQKRGEIKPGNFADLVLMDFKKVEDRATYENPYQFAAGIEYVFVNGKPVVMSGQRTGGTPGYVLRKK